MRRVSLFGVLAEVAVLAGLTAGPASAIPDAFTPSILGVQAGAEAGVLGPRVGHEGIPYYLYASAGVARFLGVKGEMIAGGSRPDFKCLSAEFSVLPLPLVHVVAEPGIAFLDNSGGPSLGLRATAAVPGPYRLTVTGYGRAERVQSRTITELGVGASYPLVSMVDLSASLIHFSGGIEPSGPMLMVGLKAQLGK